MHPDQSVRWFSQWDVDHQRECGMSLIPGTWTIRQPIVEGSRSGVPLLSILHQLQLEFSTTAPDRTRSDDHLEDSIVRWCDQHCCW